MSSRSKLTPVNETRLLLLIAGQLQCKGNLEQALYTSVKVHQNLLHMMYTLQFPRHIAAAQAASAPVAAAAAASSIPIAATVTQQPVNTTGALAPSHAMVDA
jgi:hypothetical protein